MQHQQTRRWMSAVVYSWAAPTALATIVGAAAAASCCASRACPRGLVLARDSAAPESGKSLQRLLEPGHRLVVLQAGLDLAAQRLVASSGARRKRLELLRRVQAQLEVVDKAAAQWLHSKWTFEQATSVACALSQVQSLGTGGGDNVVSLLGAVTGLLGVHGALQLAEDGESAAWATAAGARAAALGAEAVRNAAAAVARGASSTAAAAASGASQRAAFQTGERDYAAAEAAALSVTTAGMQAADAACQGADHTACLAALKAARDTATRYAVADAAVDQSTATWTTMSKWADPNEGATAQIATDALNRG